MLTKKDKKAIQADLIEYHTAKGWIYGKNSDAELQILHRKTSRGFESKTILGDSDKVHKYYSHKTYETMEGYISSLVKSRLLNKKYREEKAAKRKNCDARHHWMVGDVVYNSWGYDQTNVDFYQVIKVTKGQIQIRELHQNSSDSHGSPSGGKTQPRRNDFAADEILKKRIAGDHPESVFFRCGSGSKWDGKPKFTSSYH